MTKLANTASRDKTNLLYERQVTNMKKGDYIQTPRFLGVRIEKVFRNETNAINAGFTEPTHYKDLTYGIYGKNIGQNCMIFAAFKK